MNKIIIDSSDSLRQELKKLGSNEDNSITEIIIKSGVYTGSFKLERDNVTITGDSDDKLATVIEKPKDYDPNPGFPLPIQYHTLDLRGKNITIRNLTLRNIHKDSAETSAVFNITGDNIAIDNCEIIPSKWGIYCVNANNIRITNNKIKVYNSNSPSSVGIYCDYYGNYEISDNSIIGFSYSGILIDGLEQDNSPLGEITKLQFEMNQTSKAREFGNMDIKIEKNKFPKIVKNTIANCLVGIQVNGSNPTIEYNKLTSNQVGIKLSNSKPITEGNEFLNNKVKDIYG